MEILKEVLEWIVALFLKSDEKADEKDQKVSQENLQVEVKYMISMKEILMGRMTEAELTQEQAANVKILFERINKLRTAYGKPIKVNDGVRRPQDTPKFGSATSWHLRGGAIDLDDDDAGTLWKWIWANRFKLKEWGLWCEHPCWTHSKNGTWIHLQIMPPKSGKRFFVPSSQPNPNPSFWDGKYEAELDGFESAA